MGPVAYVYTAPLNRNTKKTTATAISVAESLSMVGILSYVIVGASLFFIYKSNTCQAQVFERMFFF